MHLTLRLDLVFSEVLAVKTSHRKARLPGLEDPMQCASIERQTGYVYYLANLANLFVKSSACFWNVAVIDSNAST